MNEFVKIYNDNILFVHFYVLIEYTRTNMDLLDVRLSQNSIIPSILAESYFKHSLIVS